MTVMNSDYLEFHRSILMPNTWWKEQEPCSHTDLLIINFSSLPLEGFWPRTSYLTELQFPEQKLGIPSDTLQSCWEVSMTYIKYPKHSRHLAYGNYDRKLITRPILRFPNSVNYIIKAWISLTLSRPLVRWPTYPFIVLPGLQRKRTLTQYSVFRPKLTLQSYLCH